MFGSDVRGRDVAGKDTTDGVSSNGLLTNRKVRNRSYDSTAAVTDTDHAGMIKLLHKLCSEMRNID